MITRKVLPIVSELPIRAEMQQERGHGTQQVTKPSGELMIERMELVSEKDVPESNDLQMRPMDEVVVAPSHLVFLKGDIKQKRPIIPRARAGYNEADFNNADDSVVEMSSSNNVACRLCDETPSNGFCQSGYLAAGETCLYNMPLNYSSRVQK